MEVSDTCHECCSVVTKLIDEANEERDILEYKCLHILKFNKVLIQLINKYKWAQYKSSNNKYFELITTINTVNNYMNDVEEILTEYIADTNDAEDVD